MSHNLTRARRVGEQIRRELAEILRTELKDPRVGMITLTGVEISADFERAKVFYTLLGQQDHAAAQLALEHAGGFLRTQVAKRLKLRAIPQLQFAYDASVERGLQLDRLIERAIREDQTHPSE
jgi:ribosome-binding factor A